MAAEADTMVKHAHGSFEATSDAPGRARLFVADALERWRLTDPDTRASVLLLTSELVTNAIRHCRRRVQLHVHYEDGALRVEVLDESPLEPSGATTGAFPEKGRGLRIVDTLSTSWGVTPDDEGKRVWFEVATAEPITRSSRTGAAPPPAG